MEYFDYLKNINGMELNKQQMDAASLDKEMHWFFQLQAPAKLQLLSQELEGYYLKINATGKFLPLHFQRWQPMT